MMRHRAGAASGVLVLALAASACTPMTAPDPTGTADTRPGPTLTSATPAPQEIAWWEPEGEVSVLARGLSAPWSVAALPDGGMLVSQRDDGVILEVDESGAVTHIGTVPDVVSGGESGLHGIAIWAGDGTTWLYAYHGAADDNRVVRMPLGFSDGARALGPAQLVYSGIARARNHDGGRLGFGPDGFLYVTTGDAAIPDAAQDPDSANGKILRLTPTGDAAPGNPFGTEVWSLGHRNVQGIAWTPDGAMWASEFGQDTWDELNRIEPGRNYGWPVHEGRADAEGFVDPLVTWRTSDASPSGIAAVGHTIFVAGLRGERLWVVDVDEIGRLAREPVAVLTDRGRLRDVVAAPAGALWVLTNNTDGRGSPGPDDDLLLELTLAAVR